MQAETEAQTVTGRGTTVKQTNMDDFFRPSHGVGTVAIFWLTLALSLLLATSCDAEETPARLFAREARLIESVAPTEIEAIKAGIAEYGQEARRTVVATERVGVYWRLLAGMYMERAMYGEAMEAARTALDYFPTDAAMFYDVGIGAMMLARSRTSTVPSVSERDALLTRAENSLSRALEYEPRHSKALYALSALYAFELGRPAAAEPLVTLLLEREPRNVDALFVLARVHFMLGRMKEAADAYARVAVVTSDETKRRRAEENRALALRLSGAAQ